MDIVTTALLEATEGINFRCGFVDGKCVAVDKRIARGLKPLKQICCRSCHHYVGYLRAKESDLPAEYLPYFSYPNGFLTENGCGLPKEMRARRCILYVCRDAGVSKANRKKLIALEGGSQ